MKKTIFIITSLLFLLTACGSQETLTAKQSTDQYHDIDRYFYAKDVIVDGL